MECSICLEGNPDTKLLNCGHMFHKNCIDTWLKIKPVCPLCRMECTNVFKHFYKNTLIKKGEIIINKDMIIIKKKRFKYFCKTYFCNIFFKNIKRIEYENQCFKLTYLNNRIQKTINIYLSNPIHLFNICKYYLLK